MQIVIRRSQMIRSIVTGRTCVPSRSALPVKDDLQAMMARSPIVAPPPPDIAAMSAANIWGSTLRGFLMTIGVLQWLQTERIPQCVALWLHSTVVQVFPDGAVQHRPKIAPIPFGLSGRITLAEGGVPRQEAGRCAQRGAGRAGVGLPRNWDAGRC